MPDVTPAPGPSTAAPAAPAAAVTEPATPTAAPAAAGTEPAAPATTAVTEPVAPAASGDPAAPAADPAPKDWAALCTEIAGEDEKLLKRLSRYSSVKDVADALIAAQNKIASGTLKSALPADATPEQLAEWRTENGIPSTPEEYDTTLPDGMVIGDFDKPVVDRFTKIAHELNMNPAQVQKTLAWYFKDQEQQTAELHAADRAAREENTTQLREEWGSEYKMNMNLVDGLLSQMPEGGKELLTGARLADGTPLGDNPKVLRWLANLAREVNPTATVVPGSGTNATQAIETELAGITKLMGDKSSEYWKGPKASAMQERYRQLIDVQQKLQKRA
jgi:hypothetical protein